MTGRLTIGGDAPLHVVAAIIHAVAHMWPEARLVLGEGSYTVDVPEEDPLPLSREDAALFSRLPALRGELMLWSYIDLVAAGTPNYISHGSSVLLGNGTEVKLHHTISWSPEQSPHQLRLKAEKERDEALAELAALRAQLAGDG